MDIRKITLNLKGENYSFIVEEDEDAKKKLREHLGLKRLPNGVEMVENKLIPLEELSKEDLQKFVDKEKLRHARFEKAIKEGSCSGIGWAMVAKTMAKNIEIAERLINV